MGCGRSRRWVRDGKGCRGDASVRTSNEMVVMTGSEGGKGCRKDGSVKGMRVVKRIERQTVRCEKTGNER